jgi:serine/threonine protein kinase
MATNFFSRFTDLFKDNRLDVSERFEILREAISGTMSNFHLVREIKTGKQYGLKLLDRSATDTFEARFKGLKKPSEGEIGLSLNHPRIVQTFELGTVRTGQQYILMEFVEGTGLNTLIAAKDSSLVGHRVSLFRQMTEAVQAVHAAGYIHRDICPRNFIVADGKNLKLIDFGLTLPAKREYMLPGNRTGTPQYMAPEIVRRRATDQRVDIFALGVTAYMLCAFTHPWQAHELDGRAALHHDSKPPIQIKEVVPKIDPLLADIIMQCIQPDPDKRPESADAVQRLLAKVKGEF